MSTFDEKKFVFHETFINTESGKTSGSGFVGVILGLIGGASFIAAMVAFFLEIPGTIDVMEKIISLLLVSGGLLGVRKIFAGSKNKILGNNNETENKG